MSTEKSDIVLAAIHSRRSHQSFATTQVANENINTIIEAAKVAPSARNQQPWHFTVVQNKALLEKINKAVQAQLLASGPSPLRDRAEKPDFSIHYNAPTLIIVSADKKAVAPRNDATLAVANIFLAAEALDLGAVWINAVVSLLNSPDSATLVSELKIPDDFIVESSIALGNKTGESAAQRQPRREGTVTFFR